MCGSPRVKCVNERQEAAAAREPHATIASPLSLARRRQRPVAVRLRQALRRAGVPAASAPSYAGGPGSFGSRSLAVVAQCLQQSAAVSKLVCRPSEVCSRSVLSVLFLCNCCRHVETEWGDVCTSTVLDAACFCECQCMPTLAAVEPAAEPAASPSLHDATRVRAGSNELVRVPTLLPPHLSA